MISRLYDIHFWDKAAGRAVRTACQGFLATTGAGAMLSDLNWMYIASATILAVLASFATSIIAGIPEIED